jgi:hypothetical protein
MDAGGDRPEMFERIRARLPGLLLPALLFGTGVLTATSAAAKVPASATSPSVAGSQKIRLGASSILVGIACVMLSRRRRAPELPTT